MKKVIVYLRIKRLGHRPIEKRSVRNSSDELILYFIENYLWHYI